jgi:hypothetical protein
MNEPDPSPSPAGERMRRHRERRRDGFRCLTIELHETEIEFLIQKGLLQSVARNDLDAVRQALHSYLDETFIPTVEQRHT